LVASGGPEALQIARAEQHIDLLITDLVMPQMSGVEVVERIRQERPEMRILFISGYTDRSLQMTESLPAKTGFLQKPFTPDVLAARVRMAIDRDGGESEQAAGSNP
jgi:CheY-like chemotaxis protein